jgi:hypothetical protein
VNSQLLVGDDGAMNDVYLHVGPVKTGSTYLQSIMWSNRDALSEQGDCCQPPTPTSCSWR